MSAKMPWLEDPEALRDFRDASLYRLLLRSSRAETTTTLELLAERGYRNLTLAYTNVLANLDTDGTTISALARRAGVTRQAASQLVAEIERAGYVTRRPDPADGRAVLVKQTAKGRALLKAALEVVVELEAQYERILGAEDLATLKDLLRRLLERIDPEGALGRD